MNIPDVEHGIAHGIEGVLELARRSMVAALARKDQLQVDIMKGFVEAIVENREAFTIKLLTDAIAAAPDADAQIAAEAVRQNSTRGAVTRHLAQAFGTTPTLVSSVLAHLEATGTITINAEQG